MFMMRRAFVIVALALGVQSASADETTDAVKVLSTLWKGASDYGSASQFVGDTKSFRMRIAGQMDDGTTYIETS